MPPPALSNAYLHSSWLPVFRTHVPKTTIIPLSSEFIDYLNADGVYIPRGSEGRGESEVEELNDDEMQSDEDEDDDDDAPQPRRDWAFPELDARIRQVIQKYDGAVFPKLNQSSPQDAAWIHPGPSLRCQSPAEIYLLLKSSDFVGGELEEAQKQGGKYELVLKKWFDMPRSQEWRCFVRNGELVGMCQRDNNYYDFLASPELQEKMTSMAVDFFEDVIVENFSESNYAFDVYFTRHFDRLFLLDFNPFLPRTDSLLFTWDELSSLSPIAYPPSSRSVAAQNPETPNMSSLSLRPRTRPHLRLIPPSVPTLGGMPRYSHNRYPREVVSMSEGKSVAEFAKEWQKEVAAAGGGRAGGEEEEKMDSSPS